MTATPLPVLTATQLSEPAPPGVPPKPVLLLGASLGTDAETLWERVVPLLADRVHLIAWDLPGHGRSPRAEGAFAVTDLADAVAALARDVPAPAGRYYAGDSLGGATGLELGLRHPGLFDGIAVICSGAALGTPASWAERAAAVRAQGTSSLVTASAGRWFAPGWLEREATLGGRLLGSLAHTDDESYARCCEALAGHDVTARLGGISDPVLAIAGELDAVAPPALAEQVARGVGSGRRLTASGVAHALAHDVGGQVVGTDTGEGTAELAERGADGVVHIRLGGAGHRFSSLCDSAFEAESSSASTRLAILNAVLAWGTEQ